MSRILRWLLPVAILMIIVGAILVGLRRRDLAVSEPTRAVVVAVESLGQGRGIDVTAELETGERVAFHAYEPHRVGESIRVRIVPGTTRVVGSHIMTWLPAISLLSAGLFFTVCGLILRQILRGDAPSQRESRAQQLLE